MSLVFQDYETQTKRHQDVPPETVALQINIGSSNEKQVQPPDKMWFLLKYLQKPSPSFAPFKCFSKRRFFKPPVVKPVIVLLWDIVVLKTFVSKRKSLLPVCSGILTVTKETLHSNVLKNL
jgi:hypothetical protein